MGNSTSWLELLGQNLFHAVRQVLSVWDRHAVVQPVAANCSDFLILGHSCWSYPDLVVKATIDQKNANSFYDKTKK